MVTKAPSVMPTSIKADMNCRKVGNGRLSFFMLHSKKQIFDSEGDVVIPLAGLLLVGLLGFNLRATPRVRDKLLRIAVPAVVQLTALYQHTRNVLAVVIHITAHDLVF